MLIASSTLTMRSWVSGRSGVTPWSFIAIAFASLTPTQIISSRPRPVSRRTSTWRPVRMCTRTLSTTISISAAPSSAMAGLSHGPAVTQAEREGDERARDEPADVGEERDVALDRVRGAERPQPIDHLEQEPEPEHDRRRDGDELVEEAEEHERLDPRTREQHEVCPEGRRDRTGRPDHRLRGRRVDERLRRDRRDASREVEQEEQ